MCFQLPLGFKSYCGYRQEVVTQLEAGLLTRRFRSGDLCGREELPVFRCRVTVASASGKKALVRFDLSAMKRVEHPVVLIRRNVLLPAALLLVLNHLESQWWRGARHWIALRRVNSHPRALVLPRFLSLPCSCSTVICRWWLQRTSYLGCTTAHSIPLCHNATLFFLPEK